MKKLVIFLMCIPIVAGPAQEVEYVSSTLFSGHMNSVTVQGSFAYCGANKSFQILSLIDPQNPAFIAGYPLEGRVLNVALSGNFAFMVEPIGYIPYCYTNYIRSYDISMPQTPILLDSLYFGFDGISFDLTGNYAFIIKYYDGLLVIDISDPWNLNVVADYNIPSYPHHIFISGNYAYVGTSWGFCTLDISDIQNINTIGNYYIARGVASLFVLGDYAYLAQQSVDISPGWLTIVDISDPANPTFAGEYVTPGPVYAVYVDGDYAYASYAGAYVSGFLIIDISDPTSPNLVGDYDELWGRDIYVEMPYCYLAGFNPEFSIFNVSNPHNPRFVGGYDLPDFLGVVAASESVAYAGTDIGLWTIDISDIHNPAILGHDETLGRIKAIDHQGNYAFTSAYASGLTISDISNPAQPIYVGSYPAQYLTAILAYDSLVFTTELDFGFIIVNITDPSNPTLASDLALLGHTEDVYIRGDYAYIANRENGLYIVDITDISDPVLVGNCDTPGYAVSVYVEGDFAYIADGYHGLQIINVQDPTNPFTIFNVDTEDYAKDIVVTGDYAIVAEDSAGLEVIDISDTGTPHIVAYYDTPGYAVDLKIDGDYIFVADYYSLMILHLDRETGTLEQLSFPSKFLLSQNYPNPFNAQTTIEYDIPIPSPVVIEIFDILGRKVETLFDGYRSPGSYTTVWNANNSSSGLYFCRLRAGEYSEIKRMVLLK